MARSRSPASALTPHARLKISTAGWAAVALSLRNKRDFPGPSRAFKVSPAHWRLEHFAAVGPVKAPLSFQLRDLDHATKACGSGLAQPSKVDAGQRHRKECRKYLRSDGPAFRSCAAEAVDRNIAQIAQHASQSILGAPGNEMRRHKIL